MFQTETKRKQMISECMMEVVAGTLPKRSSRASFRWCFSFLVRCLTWKNWKLEESWKHCINRATQKDGSFHFEVIWSNPTRRRPVPNATASVFVHVVYKVHLCPSPRFPLLYFILAFHSAVKLPSLLLIPSLRWVLQQPRSTWSTVLSFSRKPIPVPPHTKARYGVPGEVA